MSGLHSALTSRLAIHDRLLALSGRLELVVSQIQLRREAEARVGSRATDPAHYVEGESSSEDDDDEPAIPLGADAEDEGSIEDVTVGGGGAFGSASEDESEDESDGGDYLGAEDGHADSSDEEGSFEDEDEDDDLSDLEAEEEDVDE